MLVVASTLRRGHSDHEHRLVHRLRVVLVLVLAFRSARKHNYCLLIPRRCNGHRSRLLLTVTGTDSLHHRSSWCCCESDGGGGGCGCCVRVGVLRVLLVSSMCIGTMNSSILSPTNSTHMTYTKWKQDDRNKERKKHSVIIKITKIQVTTRVTPVILIITTNDIVPVK